MNESKPQELESDERREEQAELEPHEREQELVDDLRWQEHHGGGGGCRGGKKAKQIGKVFPEQEVCLIRKIISAKKQNKIEQKISS